MSLLYFVKLKMLTAPLLYH